MKVKVGTRKSALAMWQTNHVCDCLHAVGIETEIVKIETKGDKILDVTLSKIGSKGVFTEEIEEQLSNGTIDIAVHSAKDMSATLPEGFSLIAFGEREEATDVIIGTKSITLDEMRDPKNNIRIGTSSTRRVALLKKNFPGTVDVPIRGNLQKRMERLQEGKADFLLLAKAGVIRQDLSKFIQLELPTASWCPPAGQGSVTIECHDRLDSTLKNQIKETFNHPITAYSILAERAFLKEFNGGCSIPIFVHVTPNKNSFSLQGGIVSLDGAQIVQVKNEMENPTDATEEDFITFGKAAAIEVLELGGKEILETIKKQLSI